MIRQNQRLLNVVNALLDGALLIAAYLLSAWIWLDLYRNNTANPAYDFLKGNLWAAGVYALLLVGIYCMFKLYGSFRFHTIWSETAALLEANALGVLGVAAALYLFRLQEFSRGVLLTFYLLSCFLVIGKRVVLRKLLRYYRQLGYNQKNVLLVGCGKLAEGYVKALRENPHFGFAIVGYVADQEKVGLGPWLGRYEDLERRLEAPGIDEVVVALEPNETRFMTMILAACEKEGVKVSVIPFYNDYIPAKPTVDLIGDTKLINLRSIPLDSLVNAALKRGMDIVGSLVLIALTSPFMLVAALGVRLSSPGPVLFRQQRVGLNKKPFTMYKFRSMRVNAAEDTAWSKNEDPRKTKFGSFIRKTSLDELPQFFNVLKGDMSLIGPRPEIPFHVNHFKEEIPLYLVRQQVRPGITGWAQVHGLRGDTSIEERIKYDIWYIEHWTLWLDIKILFLTVFGGMLNQEKLAVDKQKNNEKETTCEE